jgi:hypothetical protein
VFAVKSLTTFAGTAVIRGAVFRAMQPNLIRERKSPMTYGVRVGENTFHVILGRGEPTSADGDHPLEHTFRPLPGSTTVVIQIYSTKEYAGVINVLPDTRAKASRKLVLEKCKFARLMLKLGDKELRMRIAVFNEGVTKPAMREEVFRVHYEESEEPAGPAPADPASSNVADPES